MYRRRPFKSRYAARSRGRRSFKRMPLSRTLTVAVANKCVDVPLQTQTITTSGNFLLLNGIVQGAAFYQRLGSRFQMKQINLRFNLYPVRTNAAQGENMRMVLFYDRQANGNPPTSISELLVTRDSAGNPTTTPHSQQNVDKRSRFVIIKDWWQPLPTLTYTAGVITNLSAPANNQWNGRTIGVKLPGLITQCDGATAAIGDIETGSLYLLTLGNLASGAESHAVDVSARLFFYDAAS